MAERIDDLESQLAAAEAKVNSADATASNAMAIASSAAKEPEAKISWKGAPKLEGKGGWSFKPRGRLQYDAGVVNAPGSISDKGLGFANEVRRARLGVEGDIPGGFGYKFELDFAGDEVEITDAVLSYKDGSVGVMIGQHNNFQSLEELTSSRFISFMERAAFTDAFGFERRAGVSGSYKAGPLLAQAGVFTDNISDLNSDENNSYGFDGRLVYAPRLGSAQLHLGASVHYRDIGDAGSSVRYRQRPFVHTSDTRFIDTGSISASSETGYGLEAAAVSGPLHFAGEAYWQKVNRPGQANPTFFGGYAELGYFLTRGDTRGYKNGIFDRVKPTNGVDKGGLGAIQVNLRYDRLDLNDAGIIGGAQDGYAISLIWTPTSYTRLMMNYGRMEYSDAAIPAAGDTSYGVDAYGMRAQLDF
ncbi:MAG: porin [Novosphingobium sp.]